MMERGSIGAQNADSKPPPGVAAGNVNLQGVVGQELRGFQPMCETKVAVSSRMHIHTG